MSASISLAPIANIFVQDGGYRITATPSSSLGSNQGILLEVGIMGLYLDISNGYAAAHMPYLLELIARGKMWAQKISCRALLVEFGSGSTSVYGPPYNSPTEPRREGVTILAESAPTSLATPVEPYGTQLTYGRYAIGVLGRAIPRIKYAYRMEGTEKRGAGRLLTPVINGRHYFITKWGCDCPFETDDFNRGFDCTTYILTAYDVARYYRQGDGADVADCLDATGCGLWSASATDMAKFFEQNTIGEFVMWKPMHHVVMVIDGFVHEFTTANVMGYRCTQVQEYLANAKKGEVFSVAGLPGTPVKQVQIDLKPGMSPSIGLPSHGTVPSYGGGSNGSSTYTVVSGDSLSLISGRKYGDVLLWPIVYDANKSTIGSDPNRIYPGQKFTIPNIQSYSSSQLASARSRGRSC